VAKLQLDEYKQELQKTLSYTFFCIGKPEGQPRQAGVGFAVRSSMLQNIQQSPIGI